MKTKHRMVKTSEYPNTAYNYRGYCIDRRCKGNAGCLWQMADENGEWSWFFRTLAEFRRTVDKWERKRAALAAGEGAK